MAEIINQYKPKFILPYSSEFSLNDRIADTKTDSSFNYKTSIVLKNVSTSFANTLRRTFSSLCPTIIFSNKYHETESSNSIQIKENTSALHNEFLAHRLSLIPIKMNVINKDSTEEDERRNYYLNFETHLDETTRKRQFKWLVDSLPVFKILTKLATSVQNDIFDITTNNFDVTVDETVIGNLSDEFFPKDYFTGDHIVINKLKLNLLLSEQRLMEKIHLKCIPEIGLGVNYSGHDPTGTVEYSFILDTDVKIKQVFEDKIKYMNIERSHKQLNEYNLQMDVEQEKYIDPEVQCLKQSFNLLDKYRVYKQNTNGNPAEFKISVESIGFMTSDQIILDSTSFLLLQLYDIRDSLDINLNTFNVGILGDYLEINDFTEDNIHEGLSIIIKEQTHTLGNLLQEYLRKSTNLLIANYRMPHPAINTVEFIVGISNKLSIERLMIILNKNIQRIENGSGVIRKFAFKNADLNTSVTFEKDIVIKLMVITDFILAINGSIKDLTDFIEEFKSKSSLINTTYMSELDN